MDIKEIFSNLISNIFIPGFDYRRTFQFQTVFYYTGSSYCICDCAFKHEYLEYLLEYGVVNEDLSNNTLENIIRGKCPHVDTVNKEYIRLTSVSALQIAAAVGTERALKEHTDKFSDTTDGVFKLSPFQIAVLKQTIPSVNIILVEGSNRQLKLHAAKEVIYYRRENKSSNTFTKELISPPVFCVMKRNRPLLQAVLNISYGYYEVYKALNVAFKEDLKDMVADLIVYIRHVDNEIKRKCMVPAVVHNQPTVLDAILKDFHLDRMSIHGLTEISRMINRTECLEVLKPYHAICPIIMSINNAATLIKLLQCLENSKYYSKDILPEMRKRNYVKDWINKAGARGRTRLHHCVDLQPQDVKFTLELGAEVDSIDMDGYTPLMYLLSQHITLQPMEYVREIVGLLLQENPSVHRNKNVVKFAIERDELYMKPMKINLTRFGKYKANAEKHSLLGVSSTVDDALLYLGPLLIECGFPVTRDVLHHALEKTLHSAEHVYIRSYLDNLLPRSLKLLCRDTIRKHFQRHQLNSYVDSKELPSTIKDYVLLKYLF